jgi:hypothetical protein
MCPDRSTARETGVSFSKERCVAADSGEPWLFFYKHCERSGGESGERYIQSATQVEHLFSTIYRAADDPAMYRLAD